MPTLTWVGKDKVVNHHHEVPLRVLNKQSTFTAAAGTPENSTGNRIIHGDNLEALKSLLPEFEGRVKCIYIDPPYNTGNEGWVYNDAVNDPRILKWLGEVVGKEGDDLTRHDKWLCMMYPRLRLLHKLLAEDGAIFISIDDHELGNLLALLREIFGTGNEVATLVWEKGKKGDSTFFSVTHEYVCVFVKNKALLKERKVKWRHRKKGVQEVLDHYQSLRNELGSDHAAIRLRMMAWYRQLPAKDARKAHKHYNWSDERGLYFPDNFHGPDDGRKNRPRYPIPHPVTGQPCAMPSTGWRWEESTTLAALAEDPPRIHFGVDHTTIPNRKSYLFEVDQEPMMSAFYKDGRAATLEVESILGNGVFQFPKDSDVLSELIGLVATEPGDIVLDSFAGSGTTAHAVLKLNAQDKKDRRFILVEMMEYADTLTSERVRRVMNGYGEGDRAVAGLGGSFDYYTIGDALFVDEEQINDAVPVDAIRSYVAYAEGIPVESRAKQDNHVSPALLGRTKDTAWFFHYSAHQETALDFEFLSSLKVEGERPALTIIYADKCLLSSEFLAKNNIVFKKIPRDISRF